jgi:hypothetical protein
VSKRFLSDASRGRLRHVRVGSGAVDLSRFPDFLIVGPQRTGTTWIHENLRDHPDILWPRVKEVFFFSRLKAADRAKFVSADLDWYLAQFHDPLWLRAVKTALTFRSSRSLYRPRMRGEATASYAAMDPDLIDEVVALNPQIRAIMMIRNPIDRAWSHAKKDLVRNRHRRFEDVSEREFEEFFRDPYQLRLCAVRGELRQLVAAVGRRASVRGEIRRCHFAPGRAARRDLPFSRSPRRSTLSRALGGALGQSDRGRADSGAISRHAFGSVRARPRKPAAEIRALLDALTAKA